MNQNITANTINKLLQNRHAQDVYVSQCKTGASWSSRFFKSQHQLLILDGWAMKKKWTKPLVIGYEIKVSRSDFMGDDKWQGYLPYCNELYFVSPPGVIMPTELPAEVGLIYISKTGTKLFEKKKAVYRDVQIPESIFRYILMARTKIVHDTFNLPGKKEFWQEWVKDKKSTKGFGMAVARSIRQEIEERVELVEEENRELQSKIKKFEEIKQIIELAGMNAEKIQEWGFKRDFERKINELKAGFPEGFDIQIKNVITNLRNIHNVIWNKQ